MSDPDAIYTDADGHPIERPDPAAFRDPLAYATALYAYNDRIADIANKAFDRQFRISLRAKRTTCPECLGDPSPPKCSRCKGKGTVRWP